MPDHPAEAEIRALSRRRFLKYGLIATAGTVAALGGTFAFLARSPKDGEPIQPGIRALSASEYHLLAAVCAASLPGEDNVQGLVPWNTLPVLANLDALIAGVPAHARGDVAGAFKLIDHAPVLGYGKRFADLTAVQAREVLQAWNEGGEIRRAVSNLVRRLAYVAYWQDSATWSAVGFDGPVVEKWGLVRSGNTPMPARYRRGQDATVSPSGTTEHA